MLHDILLVLLGLVIGAVAGFFIARKVMEKYLKREDMEILVVQNLKHPRENI